MDANELKSGYDEGAPELSFRKPEISELTHTLASQQAASTRSSHRPLSMDSAN